jgi:hypothetical protein
LQEPGAIRHPAKLYHPRNAGKELIYYGTFYGIWLQPFKAERRRGMSETLSSEQKGIAEKTEIIASLEQTVLMADTCISSISYFAETDMVRIRHKTGYAVCISAEGKSALALLYEALYELKPFLFESLCKKGWAQSFGPGSSFTRERLS